jgi:hypothetical protein
VTASVATEPPGANRMHLLMTARIVLILVMSLLFAPNSWGVTLFETAEMGPVGFGGGFSVGFSQSIGARFEVSSSTVTTEIGGHFRGLSADSFFGAIVRLSGPLDVPDSIDLTTPDLLASVLFFPDTDGPSAELSQPLVTVLDPGWYALIFGGDSLGASSTGTTLMPGGNLQIGDPSYITRNLGNSQLGWFEPNNLSGVRMFVNVIPEPSTATLLGLGLLALGFRRRAID